MKDDLSELRKIAEAEESQKWGPWAFEEGDFDGYSIYINDGYNFGRSYVAQDISQGDSDGKSTAEFIATFDPPTVLDLIDQIEYYKRENETLAALGKANHEWNVDNRNQLKGRLERAEQAEQRVRQLHSAEPARYYGTDLNPHREYDCSGCGEGRAWPCATIRILDGDERG